MPWMPPRIFLKKKQFHPTNIKAPGKTCQDEAQKNMISRYKAIIGVKRPLVGMKYCFFGKILKHCPLR